jgi:hypothetical protein
MPLLRALQSTTFNFLLASRRPTVLPLTTPYVILTYTTLFLVSLEY